MSARKVVCFYHSDDPQSVVAAALSVVRYPTAVFYNIKGLNATQITNIITGIGAATQDSVIAVCDKTSSNFDAFLTAGHMTALDGLLIAQVPGLDPYPDAAVQDYTAQDDGGTPPAKKLRPRLTAEALWPSPVPVPKLAHLLGGYYISTADTALPQQIYLGVRSSDKDLTDADYLQSLKDAISEDLRVNNANTIGSGYPQDLEFINQLAANGVIVQNFIASIGSTVAGTLPEGTPAVG